MRYFFIFAGFLVSSLWGAPLQAQDAPTYGAPETAPVETAPVETALVDARKEKSREASRRRESRREQVEKRLRAMMNEFGVNGDKQDVLVAYLAEDEAGRVAVREATKRLVVAVRSGADVPSMRELISGYKAALEADKERRAAAQTALDAKIGFSRDPRLEAVLWLSGVLGEGQPRLPFLGSRAAAKSDQDAARRGGVVVGTLEKKSAGWIEVRESGGPLGRYFPLERAPETGASVGGVMSAIRAAKIGDRVRLEWVGSERRRLVKLELGANFALGKNGAPQNTSTKTLKTRKNRVPLPRTEGNQNR